MVTEIVLALLGVFFFQAEDGIRDLVRSRGLGDVYKRQVMIAANLKPKKLGGFPSNGMVMMASNSEHTIIESVSYTHLTLPTSDLV